MKRRLTRYAIAKSPRSTTLSGDPIFPEFWARRCDATARLATVVAFKGWSRAEVVKVSVALVWEPGR